MSSTGNVFAGTGENNAGIGATAWTNPGNVTANDTTDATCNAGASSQYLVARNFGFALPAGATVAGITVSVEASEHSAGQETLNARLQDDTGALVGSTKTVSINGTTKTVYTYGGTADVWGATLTQAIVNHANFGVRFWFTTSHDVRIDYVQVAVEYTEGSTALTTSVATGGQTAPSPGTSYTPAGHAITGAVQSVAALASQTALAGSAIASGQGFVARGGGQEIASGSGSVVGGQPLAGAAITSGQGDVATDAGAPVAEIIVGEASAVGQGSSTQGLSVRMRSKKVGGGAATFALGSQLSPVSIGAVSPVPQIRPTTVAALLSAGSVGRASSRALSGSATTAAPGTISAVNGNQTFAWQFADAGTVSTGANPSSVTLATGVPGGAIYTASPDLLPGQTLSLASGTLSLVGDSTVPTVNGDTPGSLLDSVSDRDIVIEVMDAELATANHIRSGSIIGTYGFGQAQPIWYAVQDLAQDGDVFEISPGAITGALTLGVGVPSSYLESAILKVNKSITLRGMTGRGRWRLLPSTFTPTAANNFSGVLIISPGDIAGTGWDSDPTTAGRRKTIVVQDFDFNNWGTTGSDHAVKMRSPTEVTDWSQIHTSVTFSNFKVGKLPFYQSASGFSGAAETLIFSDGYVFDTGDGVGAAAGNDHNFYITARYLTMTGVRAARTRSAEYPFNPLNKLDGHILKATFHYATLEGCVFDCGPEGDNSKTIQAKGGGNLTVRGCLFIMGQHAQDIRGGISFEKETNNYGGDWFYGAAGHSLLIEKNVFINHRAYASDADAMAMVYFYPTGSDRQVVPASITSCVIRDNIGMSNGVANTLWIANPPPSFSGAGWATSNSTETYASSETPFSDKLLKSYSRAAGTIAASGGTVGTRRFTWPHGSIARSDAFRGLA